MNPRDEEPNDEPTIFEMLPEQILLTAIVDRMVNANYQEAVNLSQVSFLYYSVFRDAIAAKRLLQLTADVNVMNPSIYDEFVAIDIILEQDPASMFRHSETINHSGEHVRTTPVKLAIENGDAYLLKKYMQVAEKNHLLEKFVSQASGQKVKLDLTEDHRLCNEYQAEVDEVHEGDNDINQHYAILEKDTFEKVGKAQKYRPRFFYDAICSVDKHWGAEGDLGEIVPPESYYAKYHATGGVIDLSSPPEELELGKNFAIARAGEDEPEIEMTALPGASSSYDNAAFDKLVFWQTKRVHEIIDEAALKAVKSDSNNNK